MPVLDRSKSQAAPRSPQPNPPVRQFSFTDFQTNNPSAPLPADRIDGEIDRTNNALADTLDWVSVSLNSDGSLKPQSVGKAQLQPGIFDHLETDALARLLPSVTAAETAATQAVAAAAEADQASLAAASQNTLARDAADRSTSEAQDAASSAAEAAQSALDAAQSADQADDSANHAAGDAALAQDWGMVSVEWAEHMPDTIPPNILAAMAITGDHWSSRWWANRAAQIVQNALGSHTAVGDAPPPAPKIGDAWWDSAAGPGGGQLYIFYDDGSSMQWVPATNLLAGPTGAAGPPGPAGPTGPSGPPGTGSISGMVAGQIPIAATSTAITASANLSGDVSSNATLVTTLATVNANVGTFQGLTLDGKGRVTAAANQSYAPLASPVFTGDPKAPTPATADNDTSIATTAYVQAQNYLTTTAGLNYVLKAGDTMTGELGISGASSGLKILDRGGGGAAGYFYRLSNITRFLDTVYGSDVLTFNSSGNVGVNTATPVARFSVHAGADQNGVFGLNGGLTTIGALNDAGNAWVPLQINPNGPVYIAAAGSSNVGIGTTTPGARLEVKGAAGVSTPLAVYNNDYASGTTGSSLSVTFGAASGNTYASLVPLTTGNTAYGNLALCGSGGNVSIGTTTPGTSKLLVKVGTDQNVSTGVNGGFATFGALNDAASGWVPLQINPAGNLYLCGSGGNVGIGTTSPQAKFQISASVPMSALTDTGGGADVKTYDFAVSAGSFYGRALADNYGSSTNWLIVARSGITATSVTFPTGGVVVGAPSGGSLGTGKLNAVEVRANNVVLTSDIDVKTDIQPLQQALPIVADIEPKAFRWKPLPEPEPSEGPDGEMTTATPMAADFTEKLNRGFIVQDVIKAIGGKAEDGVDLGGMVAILWQAVRELRAELHELKGG